MVDEARLRTLLDLLHGPDLVDLAALRRHLARLLRGSRGSRGSRSEGNRVPERMVELCRVDGTRLWMQIAARGFTRRRAAP